MAYDPILALDNESVGAEIKRMSAYINANIIVIDNVTVIATADGSDPATTQTLANACKAKINELLTAFHDAGVAANIAVIATADGSDAGTTQTLANACKAKINALLAELVSAEIMAAP